MIFIQSVINTLISIIYGWNLCVEEIFQVRYLHQ